MVGGMVSPGPHDIEASSGLFVNVVDPSPDMIRLEDIAHALGRVCRYSGHCREFYSVAEHAVFVSHRLQRQGYSLMTQLLGLHHDDAEAYLCDIPRPIKSLLQPVYGNLSDKMDAAIALALGLDFEGDPLHLPEIKDADNWALLVEARHLLPSQGRTWTSDFIADQPSRIVTPDYWTGGLSPKKATKLFLDRHHELMKGLT